MKKLNITAEEIQLQPITEPLPAHPVFRGEMATTLQPNKWCECKEWFENQIVVPKRHSLVCFCPKCGCVTQD